MNFRVSDKNKYTTLLQSLKNHTANYVRYTDQITSGVTITKPSDSHLYSDISFRENNLIEVNLFLKRINYLRGFFDFVEENLNQANNVLIRAKEIAVQASNETLSPEMRARLSLEVFQLRDHLVQLANAKYQDRYIWAGADDDDPPFDQGSYIIPTAGPASVRYYFDNELGTNVFRRVQISHNFDVQINESGAQTFAAAIGALERLGRALAGYSTNPPTGLPDGTGAAYNFPADYSLQTSAIRQALDLIEQVRVDDITNMRTIYASKMTRLDIAQNLLGLEKLSDEEYLSANRDTDIPDVASKLARTETFIQATYQLLSRVSRLNLLDYL